MAAYGTIRKQIAKLTGEIPELADLDRYVNDLKSSAQLAAKEVVRTVKVPDESVVAEVMSLRRERIVLEEAQEEQRKTSEKECKEVHDAYLRYRRSLRFGLLIAEYMLPAAGPASQAALMGPRERLIVVDRNGTLQGGGGLCYPTHICGTIPHVMQAIKECPGEVLIYGCGNGIVTRLCVVTHSACADVLQALIEKGAELLLNELLDP